MKSVRNTLVVVLVALASTVLSSTANAAPESGPTVAGTQQAETAISDASQIASSLSDSDLPSCADQHAAQMKKITAMGNAQSSSEQRLTCVTEVPNRKPADASAQDIWGYPDICIIGNNPGYVTFTRTQSCERRTLRLSVTDNRTKLETGAGFFVVVHITTLSTSLGYWRNEVRVKPQVPNSAWGDALNVSAYTVGSCDSNCTIGNESYNSVFLGEANEGTFWAGPVSNVGPGTAKTSSSTLTLYFYSTKFAPGFPNTFTDFPVRCDRIRSGTGCVHSQLTPTMTFSLSSKAAQVALHIQRAQSSGLPGAFGSGRPLKYMADSTLQNANYNKACPSSWPRYNMSCDEYPFKTTFQGASTGGGSGRTFANCNVPLPTGVTGGSGYSSCMVPKGSNSSQGGYLSGFYNAQRIVNGDDFYVAVTQ